MQLLVIVMLRIRHLGSTRLQSFIQWRAPSIAAPAAGSKSTILGAMEAAAYLHSKDVDMPTWAEAIPGQANIRPWG